MKYNTFTFQKNKLLCWRLGPINSQKQIHFSKDVKTIAGGGTHKPPTSRGIWAFPYPHYDFFFCFHQWKKHLPKKYLDDTIEKTEKEWEEYYKLLEEIQKKHKPSTFYVDNFYSHISPKGCSDYNGWFYWDNVREWGKVAQKTLYKWERFSDGLFRMDYSKDHLELFIPNY